MSTEARGWFWTGLAAATCVGGGLLSWAMFEPDDSNSDLDTAFVLVAPAGMPDESKLVDKALELGWSLTPSSEDAGESLAFDIADGGTLTVFQMPIPHPDAAELSRGLTSPDPDEAAAAPAHLVVVVSGQDGRTVRERDMRAVKATAAVTAACTCAGAMLGHGTVMHRAAVFSGLDAEDVESGLPVIACLDVTLAAEGNGRVSLLTHGMARYGREELFVQCAEAEMSGGIDFTYTIADWLLSTPDKHVPTGDTVGRSPDEKIPVERVSSPVEPAETVMLLRL